MEDKICLDTDFLVEFLRNKENALNWIKENKDQKELATTIINIYELYYGAFKIDSEKELAAVEIIKNSLRILDLDEKTARDAGKITAQLESAGNMLDFRDILIGSIALSNNFALKTNNKKHFERIDGLDIS